MAFIHSLSLAFYVEAAVVCILTSAISPAEMAFSLALLLPAVAAVAALLRACWPQQAARGASPARGEWMQHVGTCPCPMHAPALRPCPSRGGA